MIRPFPSRVNKAEAADQEVDAFIRHPGQSFALIPIAILIGSQHPAHAVSLCIPVVPIDTPLGTQCDIPLDLLFHGGNPSPHPFHILIIIN
jgi:hypothetical protein